MIGVAVIHYGEYSITDRCVASFEQQDITQDVKIYVYDANKNNIGYGAACNVGFWKLSDCERVIFVNNDTSVGPDFISKMLTVDADFVCPIVVDENGKITYSGGSIEKTGPRHWTQNRNGPTEHLYGCCIMVKPQAFIDVGMFDETYFMYFEDVSLSILAKDYIKMVSPAILTHYHKQNHNPVARYYATRNLPMALGWSPQYLMYVAKKMVVFALMGKWGGLAGTTKGFIHAILRRRGK